LKDVAWLEKHLRHLLEWGRRAASVRPLVRNEFGPWTCLKLIALKYHTEIYTTIMNKQLPSLPWKAIDYVDILAGSGLDRIRETGSLVSGSTVVACESPRYRKFDYILAIENNPDYAMALAKRLALFREPRTYEVIGYDAGDHIDSIERVLAKHKAHYLAFVDYEGLGGFPWPNMERLLRHRGDLFITFIPNIGRVLARDWEGDREAIAQLVGEDVAFNATTQDDLFTGYLENIRRIRPNSLDIRIQSGGSYHYILIFCAGQKRVPGWFDALKTLKSKIETFDGLDVKEALDRVEGHQATLGGPPDAP